MEIIFYIESKLLYIIFDESYTCIWLAGFRVVFVETADDAMLRYQDNGVAKPQAQVRLEISRTKRTH